MQLQSASSNGSIAGSALWLLYTAGQTAPLADGGKGGLYGIYDSSSDSTFAIVQSNAQVGLDI